MNGLDCTGPAEMCQSQLVSPFEFIAIHCFREHLAQIELSSISFELQKFNKSEGGQLTELIFAAYNLPTGGENLLAGVDFKPEELFSVNHTMEEVFWLEINSAWFEAAGKLQVSQLYHQKIT